MPEPGQEPFLSASFFPVRAPPQPTPIDHPVLSHSFCSGLFLPGLSPRSLRYSYNPITLREPRACPRPAHTATDTSRSLWSPGQVMLWDLPFRSPHWLPVSLPNRFSRQVPASPLCSACLRVPHLSVCLSVLPGNPGLLRAGVSPAVTSSALRTALGLTKAPSECEQMRELPAAWPCP